MNETTNSLLLNKSDLLEEKLVNLKTLMIPYLDILEDGDQDTASLKWIMLGVLSAKDHAKLKNILIDYQENVGALDSKMVYELLHSPISENNMEVAVISQSDNEHALSDLAVWNDEVDSELGALEWLIRNGYDTQRYKSETAELYNKLLEQLDVPEELTKSFKKIKDQASSINWMLDRGLTVRPQAQKEEKKESWDDEYWKDTNIALTMRSAAVRKLNDRAEYNKGKKKEIISDGPLALVAAYSVVNWATSIFMSGQDSASLSINIAATTFTVLGGTVAAMIHGSEKTTEKELFEIIEALSRFRMNKENPEISKEEAVSILRQDATRLNIKLSNIEPVTIEEFRAAEPELREIAYEQGYLERPDLNAKKIQEAGESLMHIGNRKMIASKLFDSIKNGTIEAWDLLVDSVRDWKKPIALAHGTYLGMKGMAINAIGLASTFQERQKKTESKIALDRVQGKVDELDGIKIEGKDGKKLPITEEFRMELDLDRLEAIKRASSAVHENIETYKKRRPKNYVQFGLASGLAGIAGGQIVSDVGSETAGLISAAIECVKAYMSNPDLVVGAQDMLNSAALMLQDAVADNGVGILTNAWGIVMGGAAALSATGKPLYNDTMALRSEFKKLDKEHSSLLDLEKTIKKIHTEQRQKLNMENLVLYEL